jgi:hypothetical protein
MAGGAPKGNTNAKSKGLMRARLLSRIEQKQVMDELADALIEKALGGDLQALIAIYDRIDGKPAQTQVIQGDEDSPLQTHIKVSFIE